MKKIKIAIVAPPFGETGGPEVVVKNLVEALTEIGADITLFAPADWKVKCKHTPTLKQSLWNRKDFVDQTEHVRRNLIIESQIKILFEEQKFDLIHLHSQRYAYLVGRYSSLPCVLSLHNKIRHPELKQIKDAKIYPVFLSRSQMGRLTGEAIIKNGAPVEKIKYSLQKEKYLIAIGRLTEQKGIDQAIKIARKAKKKLLIFGRTGNSKERQIYFNQKIKPFIDNKLIIYKGQVSQKILYSYLKNAEALLFTISRPEVCPLTIMESLACGTPVIGTRIEPLPELLDNHPKIAFLSNNFNVLVKTVKNTESFDCRACRKYAEKYFSAQIMAEKYLKLYEKIIA